jgi:predicted benzoate:H+ symporter BenE
VSGARAYRSVYHRPVNPPPNRAAETERKRSHAAIPVAIVFVVLGLYLSQFTILITALLGIVLFFAGASFLSTRLNPLSPHFYLTRKPSWLAIGVVFLSAFALLGAAYWLFVHGLAPIVPRL